jgi:hypothetical protein
MQISIFGLSGLKVDIFLSSYIAISSQIPNQEEGNFVPNDHVNCYNISAIAKVAKMLKY